jgi:hypothetical protein
VEAGKCAAGVHSWWLESEYAPGEEIMLAGPTILHFRFASVEAFCKKYLMLVENEGFNGVPLFPQSRAEKAALSTIKLLQREGVDTDGILENLKPLYKQITHFTPGEIDQLNKMGLVFRPELKFPLTVNFS